MAAAGIYFHPDMLEGGGRDLVGRRSAGESFFKAWAAHGPSGPLGALVDGPQEARALTEALAARGIARETQTHALRSRDDFTPLGTIFFPGPGYVSAAWRRLRLGPQYCSLVGITHTIATRRITEALHALMSEPVEEWDAIICTSRAVKGVMQRQFEIEAEYFRRRFGAARVPQPQLPVIPLGINTADFVPEPGVRAQMRARFGAPDDAFVVMTMGRLSVVEKANPVPLFLALERVAAEAGRPVHLWLAGWASRPEEEALHREGAAALCPSVTLHLPDGRDAALRRGLWAGADVFTLPAESIQETFGLVPVEAQAAGLPVVMPDWDGFRDTVLPGETGYLIPTRMAPPGTGGEIARRFAAGQDDYLHYLTLVQAHISVDVPAYAGALSALARAPERRAEMGRAAAAHARATFDWRAVIPAYLALADELAARRAGAVPSTVPLGRGAVSPLEADPFLLYAGYPAATVTGATRASIGALPEIGLIDLLDRLSGRQLYRRQAVPREDLMALCRWLGENGPASLQAVSEGTGMNLAAAIAGVLMLAKSGLVRLEG